MMGLTPLPLPSTGWTLGDLDGLLDLYDERATLECACEGFTLTGREALSAYWAPKLDSPLEAAFTLDDMILTGDGVQLDYQNYEGKTCSFTSASRHPEKSHIQAAVR